MKSSKKPQDNVNQSFIQRVLYEPGVTPLKWKYITPIFTANFFNIMVITMAFSFIPQLVKTFGTSEIETGYQVGILASIFSFGRFVSSFFWGRLSDKFNRRNVGVLAAFSMAIVTVGFGFAFNYPIAVTMRLFQGLFSGFILIARTLIIDLTDATNRGFGMSIILATYNISLVIGASIGGFLAFPAEKYPNVFKKDGLFGQFGALLPSAVVATCLCLSTISILIFVPSERISSQQLKKKRSRDNISNDEDDCMQIEKQEQPNWDEHQNDNEKTNLLNEKKRKSSSDVVKVLRNKLYRRASVLYCVYSLTGDSFEEIFLLYAATSTSYHGFGFSTDEIGTSLIIVAVFALFLEFTLIPRMIYRMGPRKAMILSNVMKAILLPLVPACEMIKNRYVFWISMLSVITILRIMIATAYTCINLLVHNSISKSLLGTAFGMTMSISTLICASSIFALGTIFSWSLSNVKDNNENTNPLGFPFNHYFVFFIISSIGIFCALYTALLPRCLDHEYQEES